MGQNFALNMASHGFSVSVSNRSPAKVDATVERAKAEGNLPMKGFKDPKEFVKSLSKPRKVILLVQAGAAVDASIATLSEFMEVSPCLTHSTIRVHVVSYGTITAALTEELGLPLFLRRCTRRFLENK